MKRMISLATGLPSYYQIGDEALFCANGVSGIGMFLYIPAAILPGCPKCRIVSVKFTESKVIYAVELYIEYADGTGDWYEPFPLENIDSTFIQPLDQVTAYKNFLQHMQKPYMADTEGYNNGDFDYTVFPKGATPTGMKAIFGEPFKDFPKLADADKGPSLGFFGDVFSKMMDEALSRPKK